MKLTDLSQTLTILSAMITPVVLIMASSSLIMSTSQRLSRSIERTRKITDTMNGIIEKMETFKASPEIVVLFEQLRFSSLRARALQNAMSVLYVTLFIFIGSCISIAIISLFFQKHAWIPIALDLTGISLLFVSSIFLMKESRMALSAVDHEMDYTLQLFQDKFAAAPARRAWWRRWIPSISQLRKAQPVEGVA